MRRGTCCVQKAVLVTVYVEKPRRRVPSSHNHHKHHQNRPLLHHPITQTVLRPTPRAKGYDRKAELLRYSHGLRESARSTSSTPKHHTPKASHHHQPSAKVVAVQVQRRPSKAPTCFGILIPSFMRSSNGPHGNKEKKKARPKHGGDANSQLTILMNTLQGQKKGGFFSKLISKLQGRK